MVSKLPMVFYIEIWYITLNFVCKNSEVKFTKICILSGVPYEGRSTWVSVPTLPHTLE